MGAGEFLVGAIAIALTVGSLAVTASFTRRAIVPAWVGAPARLAEAVIGVAELVLLGELLGAVGLLQRWPFVLVTMVVALAASARPRRRRATPPAYTPPAQGRVPVIVAVVVVGLALNPWLLQTIGALGSGMREFDTVSYHMQFATGFVQDASVTGLRYVGNPPTTFYPANSELIHAIGIVLVHRDVLSPLLNMAWLGLALLAAWCIGRPWGVAPGTMAAAALVASVRVMVFSQGGSAKNDIVALALLLSAVAFLATDMRSRPAVALAAVAGGLAIGTRLNLIAPVLALAVVAIFAARSPRRRSAALWVGGILLGGGFWYLRNAIATGNPLPWFSVKLGGVLNLPSTGPPVDCGSRAVAHYLTRPAFLKSDLVPHLAVAWGGRWWLVFGLALAGAVAAVAARGAPVLRAIGIVALVGAVAYVFTPATAGGPGASCFEFNTRFVAPALALGLIALPIALARLGLPPLVTLAAIALAVLVDVQEPHDARAVLATVILIAVVIAVGSGLLLRLARPVLAGVVALAALFILVAAWHEQRTYFAGRYRGATLAEPVEPIASALAGVNGARVAVSGFSETYPLYGPKLGNRVVLPAMRIGGTHFAEYTSCGSWLDALRRGRYDYVVVASQGSQPSPQASWTRRYPDAKVMLSSPPGTERQGITWRWQLFKTRPAARFDPRAACASL